MDKKTERIIVKAPNITQAYLQTIRETIRIFKDCIEAYPDKKPTCNQEQYVRDVEFLLRLIDRTS